MVHQGQFGIHLLKLSILDLSLAHMGELRNFHAGVLTSPAVVTRLRNTVFTTCLGDFSTRLDFLEDADNLSFTEFRFLHVELLFKIKLYFKSDLLFEEATTTLIPSRLPKRGRGQYALRVRPLARQS